jgi:hypothetical protein
MYEQEGATIENCQGSIADAVRKFPGLEAQAIQLTDNYAFCEATIKKPITHNIKDDDWLCSKGKYNSIIYQMIRGSPWAPDVVNGARIIADNHEVLISSHPDYFCIAIEFAQRLVSNN